MNTAMAPGLILALAVSSHIPAVWQPLWAVWTEDRRPLEAQRKQEAGKNQRPRKGALGMCAAWTSPAKEAEHLSNICF